jgi:hypothetical protein
MSQDEMRNFCESVRPYELTVTVRMKNGSETFVGKVRGVSQDRFQLQVNEVEEQSLRFAWVARICAG